MGYKVTCCRCGARFDERTLGGTWLNRHCPICRKRLTEGRYDATARNWIAAHAGAKNHRELEELALSRYYTSEWFRMSCASRGSEAADKGLFGLHADYNKKGRLCLTPADDDRSPEGGWGRSAEYFVFDTIRSEITRKHSLLEGTMLVSNLVFPWLPGQKPKQWGARHRGEVDCVLLCPSCAVVVEVKRRNHHVRASKDYLHVRERNESKRFRSASEVIEQTENNAAAFEERQRLYPHERIFKLIVFVDPLSFTCSNHEFSGNALISYLDTQGNAPFIRELGRLAHSLEPLAGKQEVYDLGNRLLEEFGNTREPRESQIVQGSSTGNRRTYLTDKMLDNLEEFIRNPKSPLHGARLLRHPTCAIQVGKRGKETRAKEIQIAGLLLTRTHAILIDSKPWRLHVNTHVPFATVYVGDPRNGARKVDDSIRHDWNLDEIHYLNRSGSLTLLTYMGKTIADLQGYRERNRVCTLNVFVNPVSFHSDCDEFRSRSFNGYWTKNATNVKRALEHLVESAVPILTQAELDQEAKRLKSIGTGLKKS